MPLDISHALIACLVASLITFGTRAFPFLLFSKREPPNSIRKLARYLPPAIMAILLLTTITSLSPILCKKTAYYIACIFVAILLHLRFKNAMISIFSSTILYMVLLHIFV